MTAQFYQHQRPSAASSSQQAQPQHQHQHQLQHAPFSFHCRICYERLNLTDRPPVVLPCGHTYICMQCSARLTKCMECRTRLTPLVIKKPPNTPNQQQMQQQQQQQQPTESRYYSDRNRQRKLQQQHIAARQQQHQQFQFPIPTTVDELHRVLEATADDPSASTASSSQQQQQPEVKWPKNVVLMSLMEAAQQKQSHGTTPATQKHDDDGYESGDDDLMVLEGLHTLSSSFGTYAVKAKDGLWVYDSKPNTILTAAAAADASAASAAIPLSRTNSSNSKQRVLSRNNSATSTSIIDPPGKSPMTKENQAPSSNKNSRSQAAGAGGDILLDLNASFSMHSVRRSTSAIGTPTATSTSTASNAAYSFIRSNSLNLGAANSAKNTSRNLHEAAKSMRKDRVIRQQQHQSLDSSTATAGSVPSLASSTNSHSTPSGGKGRELFQQQRASQSKLQELLQDQRMALKPPTPLGLAPSEPKPIEKLVKGQTVQVVSIVDNVVQLARGAGYILIDNEDALVKVGEPNDEACRMEGIIFCIMEEKKQLKTKISNLNKTEKKLHGNLRQFLKKEAEEQEERRKQAILELAAKEAQKSVALALLEEDIEFDDSEEPPPVVEVTPPSTPPHFSGMSPSSTPSETPVSPRHTRRSTSQGQPQYHYEMSSSRDGNRRNQHNPASTATGPTPRPDVNKQSQNNNAHTTHTAGVTWEENMLNQGCDLFWCATMPLCVGPGSASAAIIPDLRAPPHSHLYSYPMPETSSLLSQTGGVHHQYWFRQQERPDSHFPGLERNESYGNGSTLSSNSTVASGVDFSTGLSGHMALSRGKRRQVAPRKKEVRMMSQHDGIAHIRRKKGVEGGASVISVGATVATL